MRIRLYNRVWRMTGQKGGDVHLKSHRIALNHNTSTLNRLDKVLGALCDKTEAGLMGVEFQNTSEGLLRDRGEVISVIQATAPETGRTRRTKSVSRCRMAAMPRSSAEERRRVIVV